jgi:hypothetical protein
MDSPPADVEAARAFESARAILPWMVEIRRDLHRHPELGLAEHRTSKRVGEILDELGIEHTAIAGTGVLGWISTGRGRRWRCGGPRRLPLHDAKDAPYRRRSTARCTPAATTSTPRCCSAPRSSPSGGEMPGMVKLFFQPAEETVGGAQLMIAEGGSTTRASRNLRSARRPDDRRRPRRRALRPAQRVLRQRRHHRPRPLRARRLPADGVDAIVVAAQV